MVGNRSGLAPALPLMAWLAGCGSTDAAPHDVTPARRGSEVAPSITGGPSASTNAAGENGGGSNGECVAAVAQATRAPVDLIVLVDTSGSMAEEAAQVQANINRFSEAIGTLEQDVHVVLVADRGAEAGRICVPPPLGAAACGDRPPQFVHVPVEVASSDSLEILLELYVQQWADVAPEDADGLRPEAFKAIVVVSDDNSEISADEFESRLFDVGSAHFGSATGRRYSMNPVVGWKRGTPVGDRNKCASAVNTGDVYQELAQRTGGIVESVCEKDFTSVLGAIANGVVEKTACVISLPDGAKQDVTKVEVRVTGEGHEVKLTPVTDASKCASNTQGWYYDDPAAPAHVVLCPDACKSASVRSLSNVLPKVEVLVGCRAPAPR